MGSALILLLAVISMFPSTSSFLYLLPCGTAFIREGTICAGLFFPPVFSFSGGLSSYNSLAAVGKGNKTSIFYRWFFFVVLFCFCGFFLVCVFYFLVSFLLGVPGAQCMHLNNRCVQTQE